jgi:hypothetical protein
LEEVKESVEDAAKVGTLTSKNTAAKKNIVYILQGGLYCKGYNPNGLDGVYRNGCRTYKSEW